MARRVSLSGAHLTADQVAKHHTVVEEAIHVYYTESSPEFKSRFAYYTEDEVLAERDERLDEARAASAMMVLAAIEAAFRVDYLRRYYARYRDRLSRALRTLYQDKGAIVSLSEDLLEVWKGHGSMSGRLISELRGVFRYRDWLAHGRYWVPKLGREYDFAGVYNLARQVESAMSVHVPTN